MDLRKYFNAIKMIVEVIVGFKDEALAIIGLLDSLHEEVMNFIDELMDGWQEVIDAAGSKEEREELQKQAHNDVVEKVEERYSASPTYWPRELTEIRIKARKLHEKSDEEVDEKTRRAKRNGIFKQPKTVDEVQRHYHKLFGKR